uniref:Uncharacterized protein n=1 Tax=Romanomermis culicivorax TaxID=13658 RepID=A0A915J151_ROMCU
MQICVFDVNLPQEKAAAMNCRIDPQRARIYEKSFRFVPYEDVILKKRQDFPASIKVPMVV